MALSSETSSGNHGNHTILESFLTRKSIVIEGSQARNAVAGDDGGSDKVT